MSDLDDNSSKDYSISLTIDTPTGSNVIPFDGHLQWILKYHLAMCSFMQQDYVRSQEVNSFSLFSNFISLIIITIYYYHHFI